MKSRRQLKLSFERSARKQAAVAALRDLNLARRTANRERRFARDKKVREACIAALVRAYPMTTPEVRGMIDGALDLLEGRV